MESPNPSKRSLCIKPNYLHSLRADVEAKANGTLIINMVLGEPEFPRPKFINRAITRSVYHDKAGYEDPRGMLRLRESVSRYLNSVSGVDYDPITEIVITAGAKEALILAGRICTEAQDTILTQTPVWTGYECIDIVAEGALTPIPTRGRILSRQDLEERVFATDCWDTEEKKSRKFISDQETGRIVRAILINTPNNPTGAVMSPAEQDDLMDFIKDKEVILIADEVYKSFIFYGAKYRPFCAVPCIKPKLLFIDSFSKTYNMTDLRVGYIAGSAPLINQLCSMHGNMITCLPKITQAGAVGALESGEEGERFIKGHVEEYQRRRDVFFEGLSRIKGFNSVPQTKPQGTFYAWINISGFPFKSEEYFHKLLEEGVACAPGKPFGDDNFVRYSLTVNPIRYPQYPDIFAEILSRHESFAHKHLK